MNKILKKFCEILGYKLLEKNYVKNKQFLFYKSDLTLNKIIENLIKNDQIKNLIQIGANDGKSFEELNILIKKYKIESLLVEPIKENFELLQKNYKDFKNVILVNSALSVNNEISFLYKVNPQYYNKYGEFIKAIPSFDRKHLIKHGVKSGHIIKELVNQITFLELFQKNKILNLDLLFVDTEGYDCKIIKNFFLVSKMRPIIIFEWIHINQHEFNSIVTKISNENYFIFPVNHDLICFPKEKNFFIKIN